MSEWGLFGIIVLMAVCVKLVAMLLEWWDKILSPISFAEQNSIYGKPKYPIKIQHTTYKPPTPIISYNDYTNATVKEPPKAFFFSRVEGKTTVVEGPLEMEYLKEWEKREWEAKKLKALTDKVKKEQKELTPVITAAGQDKKF
jgi:hypothetical protein